MADIVALEPGVLLGGQYTVVGPISRGAMGEVVRARHVETGTEVAIKRLLDLRNAARFEIEARLLSRLDHPRVVRVLGHFRERGGHHLVMALIRGRTLAELMAAPAPRAWARPTRSSTRARHATRSPTCTSRTSSTATSSRRTSSSGSRGSCSWTSGSRGR